MLSLCSNNNCTTSRRVKYTMENMLHPDALNMVCEYLTLSDIQSLDATSKTLYKFVRSLSLAKLCLQLSAKFANLAPPSQYRDVMRRYAGICSTCLLLQSTRVDDLCDRCRGNKTTCITRVDAEDRRAKLLRSMSRTLQMCVEENDNIKISRKQVWCMLVRSTLRTSRAPGPDETDIRGFARAKAIEHRVGVLKKQLIQTYLIPDYIPSFECVKRYDVTLTLCAHIRHHVDSSGTVIFEHIDWVQLKASLQKIKF